MKKILFLAALLTVGCAETGSQLQVGDMLPGKLIRLSDGLVIPMQAEFSTGRGKMTATNPKTGEIFTGDYTAISEAKTTHYTKSDFWGTSDEGEATEESEMVPGSATLIGDKGTVLNIKMKIKPGNPPIGYGDGEDNKGKKYSIQF